MTTTIRIPFTDRALEFEGDSVRLLIDGGPDADDLKPGDRFIDFLAAPFVDGIVLDGNEGSDRHAVREGLFQFLFPELPVQVVDSEGLEFIAFGSGNVAYVTEEAFEAEDLVAPEALATTFLNQSLLAEAQETAAEAEAAEAAAESQQQVLAAQAETTDGDPTSPRPQTSISSINIFNLNTVPEIDTSTADVLGYSVLSITDAFQVVQDTINPLFKLGLPSTLAAAEQALDKAVQIGEVALETLGPNVVVGVAALEFTGSMSTRLDVSFFDLQGQALEDRLAEVAGEYEALYPNAEKGLGEVLNAYNSTYFTGGGSPATAALTAGIAEATLADGTEPADEAEQDGLAAAAETVDADAAGLAMGFTGAVMDALADDGSLPEAWLDLAATLLDGFGAAIEAIVEGAVVLAIGGGLLAAALDDLVPAGGEAGPDGSLLDIVAGVLDGVFETTPPAEEGGAEQDDAEPLMDGTTLVEANDVVADGMGGIDTDELLAALGDPIAAGALGPEVDLDEFAEIVASLGPDEAALLGDFLAQAGLPPSVLDLLA